MEVLKLHVALRGPTSADPANHSFVNFDLASVDNMYRLVNSYGTSYTSIFCLLKERHGEARRKAIIRTMMEYLGESSGEPIKDYKVNSNIFRSQSSLEYVILNSYSVPL